MREHPEPMRVTPHAPNSHQHESHTEFGQTSSVQHVSSQALHHNPVLQSILHESTELPRLQIPGQDDSLLAWINTSFEGVHIFDISKLQAIILDLQIHTLRSFAYVMGQDNSLLVDHLINKLGLQIYNNDCPTIIELYALYQFVRKMQYFRPNAQTWSYSKYLQIHEVTHKRSEDIILPIEKQSNQVQETMDDHSVTSSIQSKYLIP